MSLPPTEGLDIYQQIYINTQILYTLASFSWSHANTHHTLHILTVMKAVLGCSMQVDMVIFLYSKVTMLKPMASGTASTADSTQITTISTTVIVGIPVPCTRDQDTTARYLSTKRHRFKHNGLFSLMGLDMYDCKGERYLSTLRTHRLRTVMPTEAFCRKGNSLQRNKPNVVSANGHCPARSYIHRGGKTTNITWTVT